MGEMSPSPAVPPSPAPVPCPGVWVLHIVATQSLEAMPREKGRGFGEVYKKEKEMVLLAAGGGPEWRGGHVRLAK